MCRGDSADRRVVEEVAAAHRTPALCGDALGPVVVEHRSLGEVRVQLDLVDRGQDAGLGFETVDLRGGEVRDPDGANHALALEPDHGAPRLDVPVDARKRPVYELSLIHISEPTRLGMISYAVFCLKKKKQERRTQGRRPPGRATNESWQYYRSRSRCHT